MAFAYDLTGPIGSRASLGLIVLQVDETIEHDFRRIFSSPEVALYVTRIPSGAELTPETIAEMEGALSAAAALLPPAVAFHAVGYACTSGTSLIGAETVAIRVGAAVVTKVVTNPLCAALTAFEAVGARRVAVVSPYIESVSSALCAALEAGGVEVTRTLSFGEEVEARVARIDPASIRAAALEVAEGAEAVFLSCTNLRTLDIIEGLEAELGVPVLSSNQVLAWHMARLSGAPVGFAPGRLFTT